MSQDELAAISKEYGLEVRRFSLDLKQVYSVIIHNPLLEGGEQCVYRRPDQRGMYPGWYFSVEPFKESTYVLARRRVHVDGRVIYTEEQTVAQSTPEWYRKQIELVLAQIDHFSRMESIKSIESSGKTLQESMK